jgi:spermidine/putrescine transport system substrate-binding protein
MAFHPRERRRYGRRHFIRLSAYGAAAAGFGSSLLAACGGDDDDGQPQGAPGSSGSGSTANTSDNGSSSGNSDGPVKLSRPDDPATLPTFDDIQPIADGLAPESGTLKVYNYEEYIAPSVLRKFQREYDVKVEVTTFTSMDEAIAKLSSGRTQFDVFFPTTDVIGKLAAGQLLQPLNKSYLPNVTNVWPSLQDPFYDKGSRYTVPYTIYTTGIGYRADKVKTKPEALENPYEIYWDPATKGKLYLLDDSREAITHMLLKNGITDVNTEVPDEIELAKNELKSLIGAANVKLSTDDYTNVPEGKAWVHQMWSGSAVSAQWYLPEGVGPEALGYWFPTDGKGPVGNDMIAIPRSAKNPVLAHHFLNYLLDEKHGYDNFANYVGYQPPFVSLDPDRLVTDEIVPANLRTAVVRESDFDTGYFQGELTPAGAKLWQNAWAEFKAGV